MGCQRRPDHRLFHHLQATGVHRTWFQSSNSDHRLVYISPLFRLVRRICSYPLVHRHRLFHHLQVTGVHRTWLQSSNSYRRLVYISLLFLLVRRICLFPPRHHEVRPEHPAEHPAKPQPQNLTLVQHPEFQLSFPDLRSFPDLTFRNHCSSFRNRPGLRPPFSCIPPLRVLNIPVPQAGARTAHGRRVHHFPWPQATKDMVLQLLISRRSRFLLHTLAGLSASLLRRMMGVDKFLSSPFPLRHKHQSFRFYPPHNVRVRDTLRPTQRCPSSQ